MRNLILFILLSFSCAGQVKNVTVQYKVVLGEDEIFAGGDMKDNYRLAVENAPHLKFTLASTPAEAAFYLNDVMDNSGPGIQYATVFSGYTSSMYVDNLENLVYQSYDDVLGKYVVKRQKPELDWTLTTETKEIGGFLCYKATAVDVVVNSSGTFSFPVTAWYTPKIPISTGPLALSGLPGLILELQRRNVVFGAFEIIINSDQAPKIPKPELKNVKTEEQVKEMREAFLKY